MSKAIEKFNGLNGMVATREELQEIISIAKEENVIDVIFRCSKVLNEEEDSKFLIEIEPIAPTGLNAPRHVGSYKEALDNCGRLRQGFKFENGSVVKVEKPVKKSQQTINKRSTSSTSKKIVAKPFKTKEKKVNKPSTNVQQPVSKVQKKTKIPVEKPTKETKKVVKPSIEPVAKVQKKTKKDVISSKYHVNDSVIWEGKKVTISKVVKIGNDVKFELNLGKNKTIWTDENTLDSEAKKPIKTSKKEVKKPIEQPVKVDASGQTSLFGVKPKKNIDLFDDWKKIPKPVKAILDKHSLYDSDYEDLEKAKKEVEAVGYTFDFGLDAVPYDLRKLEVKKSAPKKHAKISKIALAGNDQESEFFTVAGEVGKFLQQVERKPFESVVITLDGQQGAGKTTTLYKFMDSFALTGNKCLFLSLEEHPASSLAKDKVLKHLSIEAQENIDTVGEVESISELYDFIKDYEIIFIDSWQKLQRMVGAIRLDEDLRKKFHGKVFVVIFQQTTTGRTKGGAEVVFDGDIIIKMVKESSFAENYAYFDKNRYTLIPIEDIRYNIASGTCYNPNAKEEPATELQSVEEVEFNFIVK